MLVIIWGSAYFKLFWLDLFTLYLLFVGGGSSSYIFSWNGFYDYTLLPMFCWSNNLQGWDTYLFLTSSTYLYCCLSVTDFLFLFLFFPTNFQSRTDRIVFKLFGKDPSDFPLVLRRQVSQRCLLVSILLLYTKSTRVLFSWILNFRSLTGYLIVPLTLKVT